MLAVRFSACCTALPATGRGFLGLGSESHCCSPSEHLSEEKGSQGLPQHQQPLLQKSLHNPFLRTNTESPQGFPSSTLLTAHRAHGAACTHRYSQPHPSSPGLSSCRTAWPATRNLLLTPHRRALPGKEEHGRTPRPASSSLPEIAYPCPTCCPQRDHPKVPGHAKRPFWGQRGLSPPLGITEAKLA